MPAFSAPATGYIPKLISQLIVDYSRGRNDFAINEIVQITPVDKPQGYYTKFDPTAQARLLSDNLAVWKDGQALPISDQMKQEVDFKPFFCERYAEAAAFGDVTTGVSEWDVIKQHSNIVASRLMLRRTRALYTLLGTSGNYLSGHTATATALGGGVLGGATTANLYIKKTFNAAANQISKATMGLVGKDSLSVIMSPTVAYALSQTSEVHEAMIQSQFAEGQLDGDGKWARNFGLPPKLYGIRVIVDPAIEVTTKQNISSTATGAFVSPENALYFVARKGDLVSTSDFATNFATVTQFVYSPMEMMIDVLPDPINLRKIVRGVDFWDMKIVAPETSYLVTAALS
jgi:hypothetical protein